MSLFSDVLPGERSELPASIAKAVLARGLSPDELARMAGFATDPTTLCSDHRSPTFVPCDFAPRHGAGVG